MKEMERKRNRLILLMLILPLAAGLLATGCNKNNSDLYKFVVTSVTKSETSEESEEDTSEITTETEIETSAETQTEETESETTESETTEAETTTKAEAKQETKKATTKATTAKKNVKPTTKATTKKTTKATTKKKKNTPTPTKKPTPKISGYLFVGDSRTVGLDEAVDGISSIAKVGAKVTYLQSVLGDVTKTRGKNVIFNFGVNDLGNISKYISVYKSLPKEFIQNNNVIIMSVNPTDGNKYGSWNTDIDKFNKKMKANLPSGVKYLDTNSTLKKEGFSTRDGVHYKAVTYKRIAQLVFNFCGDKNRKA